MMEETSCLEDGLEGASGSAGVGASATLTHSADGSRGYPDGGGHTQP